MPDSGSASLCLIGRCLVANELDDTALLALKKDLTSRQFRWEKFCHTAGSNWLLPYIHHAFEQGKLLYTMPVAVASEVKLVRQLIEKRNQRIGHQLRQIIGCLNQYDIQPLLLKGASYLMRPVSPVQRFRMTSDIDLLVKRSSMKTALQALGEYGYFDSCTRPDGTGYHCDPLIKEGEPARLELHDKPLSTDCRRLISEQSAWQRADPVRDGDLDYYLFAPEFRLLHQFAHAQIHDRDHANDRIDMRQLYDFHLICRAHGNQLDWSLIKARMSADEIAILEDYAFMASLVFNGSAEHAGPDLFARHIHARKILANMSGQPAPATIFHWLERLTRLPGRLVSRDWYVTKYQYLSKKQ